MRKEFQGKKILVAGLARSGAAAAVLLKENGFDVFVSDMNDSKHIREQAALLSSKGIPFETGRHSEEKIKESALIVLSPGIPDTSIVVRLAGKSGIPVISEIELGYLFCPAKIIAITGTNGKTTVTTLIGLLLKAAGHKVFVGGNIGNPFCAEAGKIGKDSYAVLEVSSFQLERINKFKPFISLILNLTPDHLDRYKGVEQYLGAKKRIYMNQDENDFLILNEDDPLLRPLEKETKARVVFFRNEITGSRNGLVLNPNHLAVMAVAAAMKIPLSLCLEIFADFKGVEHRVESVRSVGDVLFINDSKGTNVDSTIWALKNMARPVILIAGGRDKKSDLAPIAELVRNKVRHMVLIGEAKDKFKSFFKNILPVSESENMESAVHEAQSLSRPGDCVLLSPMCASFDMFDNYEHRGRVFKEIVNRLR